VSENEIQRILEKIDELKDELNRQNMEWHNELHSMHLKCAARGAMLAKAEAHMNTPHQSHEEWLQNTVGKRVIMLISGVTGAVVYIMAQRLIEELFK